MSRFFSVIVFVLLWPGVVSAGGSPGSVIISEVFYDAGTRFDAADLEFLELLNTTGASVNIAGWKLSQGLQLVFPAGTSLAADARLVVTSFDPASSAKWSKFCSAHAISCASAAGFAGPYTGTLNHGGEALKLEDETGMVQDSFAYDDASPWPADAHGQGQSLNRLAPTLPGSDPASWQAALPSPGAGMCIPAAIAGRFVFYNNSAFDGKNPAANVQDDDAIATGKQALLPGQSATFANYTSYSLGLNGVMVDIANARNAAALTAADFAFRAGNDSAPSAWPAAAEPSVSVRLGAGIGGSARVTLIWPDNAIQKKWLQVQVLSNSRTGLFAPDVFYFGNAVAETGDNPSGAGANAVVDAADEAGARSSRTGFTPALITNAYDFNRDRIVNATDQVIVRNNYSGAAPLLLITVPN